MATANCLHVACLFVGKTMRIRWQRLANQPSACYCAACGKRFAGGKRVRCLFNDRGLNLGPLCPACFALPPVQLREQIHRYAYLMRLNVCGIPAAKTTPIIWSKRPGSAPFVIRACGAGCGSGGSVGKGIGHSGKDAGKSGEVAFGIPDPLACLLSLVEEPPCTTWTVCQNR